MRCRRTGNCCRASWQQDTLRIRKIANLARIDISIPKLILRKVLAFPARNPLAIT